jgi:tetratricopeptide (TPR) repeat protein
MTAPLLSLLLAATARSPCPEYTEALRRGDERHAAFAFTEAADAYRVALDLDPEAPEARLRLSEVLNELGEAASGAEAQADLDEALRYAQALRASWPEEPEGYYWVAATLASLIASRDGPEKVRLSREIDENAHRALAIDPCFTPAYLVLGITYRELSGLGWFVRGVASGLFGGLPKGSIEDAQRLLGMAVDLDPDDPFAHYQLGLTLEKRKKPGEAAAEFRRALALPPRAARDLRLRPDATERLARLEKEKARP